MRKLVPILAALLALATTPAVARAAETWAMAPFVVRGGDLRSVGVFQALLRDELASRGAIRWLALPEDCQDAFCFQQATASGTDVVVTGDLGSLGSKIIVSVTATESRSGKVRSWQKMTVDRIEDLDAAAERIARALLNGGEARHNAELGTVTQAEVPDPIRREGRRGPGLRLGGILPVGTGYSGYGFGANIELDYWYETMRFAIEPHLAVRFNSASAASHYFEAPLDLGAYYIAGAGDIAPFIGGGGGLHFIYDRRTGTVSTGSVPIRTTSTGTSSDTAFGFGLFARGGVLLLRTYTMRLAVTADVNVTFVKVNDRSNPTSFTGGLAVYF